MTSTLAQPATKPSPSQASRATAPAASLRSASIARLTMLQLRTTWSTRSGRWVYVLAFALAALVAVLMNRFGSASDHTFVSTLQGAWFPLGVLLPVAGIMLFSSEWSARTTMSTFALNPRRGRIVLAKVLAAAVIALVAFVVSALIAVLGVAIGGASGGGTWTLPGILLAQMALSSLVMMTSGAALGAALLNTPSAIVAWFALPTAVSALSMWSLVEPAIRWVDQVTTLAPLVETKLDADMWAHAASGTALWVLLPLAIGTWRILRRDIA